MLAADQLNGVGDQGNVRSITSKQYNNPVGLYSEQAIAETLSAQTEVLTTGALGSVFKWKIALNLVRNHSLF